MQTMLNKIVAKILLPHVLSHIKKHDPEQKDTGKKAYRETISQVNNLGTTAGRNRFAKAEREREGGFGSRDWETVPGIGGSMKQNAKLRVGGRDKWRSAQGVRGK